MLECKIRGVNIPANYYTKAMEVWQELRARVALPSITESYPHADDNELLDLCRKERRVELAFENHRFFDTRTWKIAEECDGGKMIVFGKEQCLKNVYSKNNITCIRLLRQKSA